MAVNTFTSAFKRDIDEIIKQPPGYKPYFLLSTKIHTELKSLDENDGVIMMGMIDNRDYRNNEFNYVEIDFYVRLGTFIYDLYPYTEDLECTIVMFRQERIAGQAVRIEERFKLVYLMEANAELPTEANAPKELMDKQPPINVRFQLVSIPTMALRVKTTQGVYSQRIAPENKDMKGESILKSILSHELGQIEVDGKSIVKFLDIEKSQNQTPMKKIVIPTGTNIMKVPNLLQTEKGGLYTGGLGTYCQRYTPDKMIEAANGVFIYSLYDGSKYKDADNKIIFYIPPDGSHNMVEKTYDYEAGLLRVLTNPIKGPYSTRKTTTASQGEGFRMANPDAMMMRPAEITPQGPKFKKTSMVTEITDKTNENNLNYATYEDKDSNVFVEASRVLARKGDMFKLVVDNLDPDYVPPAGPCVIVYEGADRLVQKLYGVIHTAQVQYYYQNFDGIGEFTMTEHAMVTRMIFDIYVTGGADQV